jgi:endonuclease/exonuclease/phosphatase family metal-dependent hydrolase
VFEDLNILEKILLNETNDTILIGDLNADGSYYDEEQITHFTDWHWIIPNNADTTVATSNNTYDRIIVNNQAYDNVIDYGIMDTVSKSQSDHYLIYAIFNSKIP